jgi:hypothetical protein
VFPAVLYSRGNKEENERDKYCAKVHIVSSFDGLSLSSGRLDYGLIVSEWNSVDKKKGRGMVAPAMIVSLLMVVRG